MLFDLRKIFKLLNGVLAALVLAAPAEADNAAQLQQAITAYQSGDYAQAFKLLQPLAQQGDALAQNNLGAMYENGQGVAQDYKQALAWFQKAANQGDVKAQNNLGFMYQNGFGVVQNYQQAKAWYQKVLAQPDTPENAEAKAKARKNLQELKNKGVR